MTHRTKKGTMPEIGNAGIGPDAEREGYFCTACFQVETPNPTDLVWEDIDLTKPQAIELRNRLTAWLKDSEAHEAFLENMKTAPKTDWVGRFEGKD